MSTAVGRALVVVMFVGAANADATPEQREQLKEAITPLRDQDLTASEAYKAVVYGVADVMGPHWRPRGEWEEWITALLDDRE